MSTTAEAVRGRPSRHVALVIPSLTSGGAERVAATMANEWAAAGTMVTLITIESAALDFYALHPSVRRMSLAERVPEGGKLTVLRWSWRVVGALRRTILRTSPDVVVAYMDIMNVMVLLAMRGSQVPVIISEHTDPRQHPLSAIWRVGRSLLYRRAAALVVMTESVRAWASRTLHPLTVLIPNPVLRPSPPSTRPAFDVPPRTVASMGRLGFEKGFDRLLQAMARCAPAHPEWSLLVLGEGRERESLEALATELGISDRVRFPGRVTDPTAVLRRTELFVVSSRYEGFSCALTEAMSCGVAVVSMDCPSGPGEIIRHETDGLLVPADDVDALAAAMSRLMTDDAARHRLGERGTDVLDRFGVVRVMAMWDALLERLDVPGGASSPSIRATSP